MTAHGLYDSGNARIWGWLSYEYQGALRFTLRTFAIESQSTLCAVFPNKRLARDVVLSSRG